MGRKKVVVGEAAMSEMSVVLNVEGKLLCESPIPVSVIGQERIPAGLEQ